MSVQTLSSGKQPRVSIHQMRRWGWITLTNVLLLGAVFLTAVPFLYMVSSSLKPQYEIFTFPVQLFPKVLFTENYGKLFGETLFAAYSLHVASLSLVSSGMLRAQRLFVNSGRDSGRDGLLDTTEAASPGLRGNYLATLGALNRGGLRGT